MALYRWHLCSLTSARHTEVTARRLAPLILCEVADISPTGDCMKKALAVALGFLPLLLLCLGTASAQSPALSLGSVSEIHLLPSCPAGFYPGASCYQAVVSCRNTMDIQVTYGYTSPRGIPRGTIVMINGAGGIEAYGSGNGQRSYGDSYLQAGYQFVQSAFASDWEDTGINGAKSIKAAACRPATLLNYFHQNLYKGDGGMCAQGASAGSGALAYSLTWYGSGEYLDKVELLSGPVFSDIQQGCMEPDSPAVTVCSPNQYGCNGSRWSDLPQYIGGAQGTLGQLTGHKCQQGNITPAATNDSWKAMSIVDGSNEASFAYPQTALSGWLCSNGLNNSAAQGQLYYRQFSNRSQVATYSLTRIDGCAGSEGLEAGSTPQGKNGFAAITADMTDPVAGCIKRH